MEILGKLQPQDTEIESSVLGAIMLEKHALSEVIDTLTPETFYDNRNATIYEAVIDLFKASQPIDLNTITNQLRKNGKLELAGGAYNVANVTTRVNSAANIHTHAAIITEMYMKRELIKVSGEMTNRAFEDTENVFDLCTDLELSISDIVDQNTKSSMVMFDKSLQESIEHMYSMKEMEFTGVPSGFKSLDKVTGGWQPTDLIVLAARPSMGKTALVVSCLKNAASMGYPIAMFSLEMSQFQLNQRLLSAETEIPLELLKKPKQLGNYDWTKLDAARKKLSKLPIYIDATPSLSIIEVRSRSIRMKNKYGIKLIIIDYLQLMKGSVKGVREQEISDISRSLKGLAKELNVPVIALSQLSRAVEIRGGDKRPQLSDLRESGSIEQDADMVGFIYRPEYYDILEGKNGESLRGKGAILIKKHRQGALTDVFLKFIGQFTKWEDDDVEEPEEEIPELKF